MVDVEKFKISPHMLCLIWNLSTEQFFSTDISVGSVTNMICMFSPSHHLLLRPLRLLLLDRLQATSHFLQSWWCLWWSWWWWCWWRWRCSTCPLATIRLSSSRSLKMPIITILKNNCQSIITILKNKCQPVITILKKFFFSTNNHHFEKKNCQPFWKIIVNRYHQ